MLFDKRATSELRQNAEAIQNPEGFGDQLLPYVVPRKAFPLEERHGVASSSDESRRCGSGRPAANNHHLRISPTNHFGRSPRE